MTRGLVYFALVFGAGFALGVVRVAWLVPRVGERVAELMEAPFMGLAILASARFVVRRFPSARRSAHLGSGLLALALLLLTEGTVVLWLRGLSIDEYVAGRDPVAGGVYLLMLALFAAMPWILAGGAGSGGEPSLGRARRETSR